MPQNAQAYVLAGLAELSERGPLFVVTPSVADAERLAQDLSCLVGDGVSAHDDLAAPVVVLPAWETLPFERVSPELSTMGQRLAVLWRLFGDGGTPPRIVVSSVRAVLQRLGPWRDAAEPLSVAKGATLDSEDFLDQAGRAGLSPRAPG